MKAFCTRHDIPLSLIRQCLRALDVSRSLSPPRPWLTLLVPEWRRRPRCCPATLPLVYAEQVVKAARLASRSNGWRYLGSRGGRPPTASGGLQDQAVLLALQTFENQNLASKKGRLRTPKAGRSNFLVTRSHLPTVTCAVLRCFKDKGRMMINYSLSLVVHTSLIHRRRFVARDRERGERKVTNCGRQFSGWYSKASVENTHIENSYSIIMECCRSLLCCFRIYSLFPRQAVSPRLPPLASCNESCLRHRKRQGDKRPRHPSCSGRHHNRVEYVPPNNPQVHLDSHRLFVCVMPRLLF